jgi:protein-disulfide isomerase
MQGFFFDLSITIFAMPSTSKTKPVLLIVTAIVVAGIIAIYMSRQENAAEADKSAGAQGAQSAGGAAAAQPGGGRIRGDANAPVTLVEFGDYECPTCGQYHPIVSELLNRYHGKLKLQYHHYPLIQIHPNAMPAALAAEAAADQGKFWEMHDLIFEHQREWAGTSNAEATFVQYAIQLGLDANKFQQSVRSPETRDRVLADVTRGNPLVDKGTPTFIINGETLTELLSLEGMAEVVDRHLAAAGKTASN